METSEHRRPARLGTSRPKPQLSCQRCRSKKNCTKHSIPDCNYEAAPKPAPNGSASKHSRVKKAEDRIHRLEKLVKDLSRGSQPVAVSNGTHASEDSAILETSLRVADPPMQSSIDGHETPTVGPTHWKAILSDLASVRDDLNGKAGRADARAGPRLLFNSPSWSSVDELRSSIPPKPVVDRLLGVLTTGSQSISLLAVTHMPTFRQECNRLYENPSRISLPFLSMLFSVLALSIQMAIRSGAAVEGLPFPEASADTYTTLAAQSLQASDYTRPTTYTVEAMLLYLACEHYWIEDSPFSASLIFSIVVRVAYRMGYHRDPIHYAKLSVFEGEMRRRTWSYMLQMDLLLNGKCGTPRAIDERASDTAAPSNLLDEDLHPDMASLPPARSADEATLAGYVTYTTSLLTSQSRIMDQASSSKGLSHAKVLKLDKELIAQVSQRPAWLAPSPDGLDTILPPSHLARTIEADLIVQTTRMMLHRKFLAAARTQPQYTASREICLASARKTLQHQRRLYDEAHRHREADVSNWRFISLMGHNFILAAVLVCVDLEQDRMHGRQQHHDDDDNRERHIQLLRQSYEVWRDFPGSIRCAQGAAKILKALLERLGESVSPQSDAVNSRSAQSTKAQLPAAKPYVQASHWLYFLDKDADEAARPTVPLGTSPVVDPLVQVDEPWTASWTSDVDAGLEGVEAFLGGTEMGVDWEAWDALFPETGLDFF